MAKTRGPRERMVFSAAQLIRRHGVAATGLREVVAHAEAPRGSLQHYFPGGKDQLVAEAATWAGQFAARRVDTFLNGLAEPSPAGLFAAMVAQWRDEFRTDGFDGGCPVAASVADCAAQNPIVRRATYDAFTGWAAAVAQALRAMGVPYKRADPLATLMISALEGAILMARAERDVRPLDTVEAELGPVLDAAVSRAGVARPAASPSGGVPTA
jgi:AcrR family transcriptional regulator